MCKELYDKLREGRIDSSFILFSLWRQDMQRRHDRRSIFLLSLRGMQQCSSRAPYTLSLRHTGWTVWDLSHRLLLQVLSYVRIAICSPSIVSTWSHYDWPDRCLLVLTITRGFFFHMFKAQEDLPRTKNYGKYFFWQIELVFSLRPAHTRHDDTDTQKQNSKSYPTIRIILL